MLYGRFFYVMIIVWFEMIFKRKFSGRFLSICKDIKFLDIPIHE